ncbi:OadG family transporter subunit [Novispirillum sp. DQ9]|uniref:OadG family transporter subunit n=1 Tax=Novispirillum sp. DQ9 TaxID=3398612 RepID=UPI003C7BBBDC
MEHLTFILSGFGVVMLVLAALWLTTAAVGRAFAAVEARSVAAPAAAPAAAAPVFEGVPPQHVAAISAAVAVLTGGRGRVVSVSAPPHRVAAWAHQGRSEQFASRRVRRDWARPGPTQSSSKGDR